MKNTYRAFAPVLAPLVAIFLMLAPATATAADVGKFEGTFAGTAEFTDQKGAQRQRDMTTTITPSNDGFILSWTSVTYKSDGRSTEKTYEVEFAPSARDNIYQSAMKTNLFGKAVPLDPLKGDPFVWARFQNEVFSVYSLFINEVGDYDMQEFHRTLVDEGLNLVFRRVHNGVPQREITALLIRQ